MEITSGIHQIDSVRGANCYLVIDESKMLVIDTGMPGNGKKIANYVERLGKDPANISYIILTHADIDHIGSAAELKQMTRAKLAIHNADALILCDKDELKISGDHLN
jgi:hydroxyacylglutathione hydrolase